jgi:hypothetical protein
MPKDDRPFFKASIEDLEKLLAERAWDRFTLARLREELNHRGTDRAKQALREVEGLLSGTVRMSPKPPGADSPSSQMDLLDG